MQDFEKGGSEYRVVAVRPRRGEGVGLREAFTLG